MKGFGYPLRLEHVREFCHPGPGPMREPLGMQGDTVATNGWVVVRVHTALAAYREAVRAHVVRDKVRALPWHTVDQAATQHWRDLAHRRPGLLKYGRWPVFAESPEGGWRLRSMRLVGVGDEFVSTEGLLQLIALLPRVEIYTQVPLGGYMPFRFSGGVGLLRGVSAAAIGQDRLQPVRFALWRRSAGELFDELRRDGR